MYRGEPTQGVEDARNGGQLHDLRLSIPMTRAAGGTYPGPDRRPRRTCVASPCSDRRDSSSDEMLMPASARIVPTAPTMPG